MIIVKATKDSEAGAMPEEKLFAEMATYHEELAKAGVLLALDGLHPSSKGARITWDAAGKPLVTDGPFSEVKEVLGGYWILQVKSREEAIEWAKRVPSTDARKIELRQIFDMTDFPADVQKAADNATVREAVEKHARA
jgi:hypothetical protein